MRRIPIWGCLLLGLIGVAPFGLGFYKKWSNRVPSPSASEERWLAANHLKLTFLGVEGFRRTMGHYPTDITDKTGKALLSWRVALLPYIEEQGLYLQFKLDEPWDSDHNLKLAKTPVRIYLAPHQKEMTDKQGNFLTHFMVFSGKGSLFPSDNQTKIRKIADGFSKTVLCVESKSPCIWTKPEDIPFDAEKDLPELNSMLGLSPEGFYALIGDGSVHTIKMDFDRKTLKSMIIPDDGKPANFP